MAIAVVQTTSGFNTTNPTSAAFTGNTTTGNLIVVVAWTNFTAFGTVNSITDSQSNTYVQVRKITGVANGEVSLWYASNITGGTTPTINVNMSASGNDTGFIAREYSGVATSSPLDVETGQVQNTTTPTSGTTAATSTAIELVVGYGAINISSSSITAGSGFGNLATLVSSSWEGALEDLTTASTGTQTATFTQGTAWNGGYGVATFKAAAGGGGTTAHNLMMLGVGK